MSSTTSIPMSKTLYTNISKPDYENGSSIWNTSISNYDRGLDDPNGVNRIPALIFSGILFAVGTVGNVHALIIYIERYRKQTTNKNKENPYFVFVLSLAVLDLLTCGIILPLDIVDNCTKFTILPERFCQFLRFFQTFLHMSSIAHVVVISIHCWRRVCFPHGRQINRRLALKLCLGCNLLPILPSVPTGIMSGNKTKLVNGETGYICFVSDTYDGTIWPKIYMIVVASLYAICLVIICISYIALIKFRWLTRHNRKHARESKKRREKKKAEKTTATLIILTVIFIVSYIPLLTIGLVGAIKQDFRKGWNIATFATYRVFARFPYLNNILNPFIYGCKDSEFKKRFIQMYRPLLQNRPCCKRFRSEEVFIQYNGTMPPSSDDPN